MDRQAFGFVISDNQFVGFEKQLRVDVSNDSTNVVVEDNTGSTEEL